MQYEFDVAVDRRNCGNTKYAGALEKLKNIGGLSYTGAEMDYRTAPIITGNLERFCKNGLFGNTAADDTYLTRVILWMERVRNWSIQKEWIVPTYGTVNAVNLTVQAFTNEGDGVIVQSPCFGSHRKVIINNKRELLINHLIYSNGKYSIDFENLEMLMKNPKAKLFILCNPHNPTTKIFGVEELTKISKLAKANDVLVISDEIFAELTFTQKKCIPYAKIDYAMDNCIICTSIGKTFNFVGTNHANIIIPNEELRSTFIKQRDKNYYGSMSPFMYKSVVAAYTEDGKHWVDELLEYVAENVRLFSSFIEKNMPDVKVAEHEAGCLIWVDWNGLRLNDTELKKFLKEEALLDVAYGEGYGEEWRGFTRIAIGVPHEDLKNALDRLYIAGKNRGFIK